MFFHIVYVVDLGRRRVVHVDDNHLPVRLAVVEKRHGSQDLDPFHLAGGADALADLARVQGVVVAGVLGVGMDGRRVFPRLVI